MSRFVLSNITSEIIAVLFTANFECDITEELTHAAGSGKAEQSWSDRE